MHNLDHANRATVEAYARTGADFCLSDPQRMLWYGQEYARESDYRKAVKIAAAKAKLKTSKHRWFKFLRQQPLCLL